MICPNCGNQTSEGAIFCDRCGTRLPQPAAAPVQAAPVVAGGSVICPACGAGNVPGEAFCDFCGSPLEPPVPAPEVAALEPVSSEAELEIAAAPAPQPPPAAEETAPAEPAVEPAAPQAPAEAEVKLTCPVCGAEVSPGEAFCSNCGASLAQAPIPPEPVPEVEAAPVAAPVEAPPVPEPEPVVAVAPAPEVPVAVPVVPSTCPSCGAEIEPKDVFCSNCGFALKAASAPAPAPAPIEAVPAPAPVPPTAPQLAAAVPRLVVVASGAEIPLPAGEEFLIGREDPVSGIYPDVDLMPHGGEEGGVSRRHARIILDGGAYFVEDLDSTNFTFVNKQKLTPKIRQPIRDGDELRCGRVAMIFRAGS